MESRLDLGWWIGNNQPDASETEGLVYYHSRVSQDGREFTYVYGKRGSAELEDFKEFTVKLPEPVVLMPVPYWTHCGMFDADYAFQSEAHDRIDRWLAEAHASVEHQCIDGGWTKKGRL